LKGDETMTSLFGKKSARTGAGESKARSAEYRSGTVYPDEYLQELTPLDIIKEDTDILTDDIRHVFELPSPPLEVADYLGHYFMPAEKAA
jgi:hypothetical protein